MLRTVPILVAYAVVVLAAGATAWRTAPPGASAATALIVPGACAAVALICVALIKLGGDRARRVGLIVGLVLPAVFAVMAGWRAWKAQDASDAHREAAAAWEASPDRGSVTQEEFLRARGAPDHDKRYAARSLWILTGVSALAFSLLVMARQRASLARRRAANPG